MTLKKEPDTLWLQDVSNVCLQQSLRNLDMAFKSFFQGRAKYPTFKKKTARQSARCTASGFSCRDGKIKLAKQKRPLSIRWSSAACHARRKGQPTGPRRTQGRSHSRKDCRPTPGLRAQADRAAHPRKPSRRCGKSSSEAHAQEPFVGKSHQQRGVAPDHLHAGLQGRVVRTRRCSYRQVVPVKQALSRLRSYLRRHAANSPSLGLPYMSCASRRQRCQEHSQSGQGHPV